MLRVAVKTLLLSFCAILLVSFIAFLLAVPNRASESAEHADAVVVLTGGGQRVELGFERLMQERADRLFITGVNCDARRDEIFATFKSLDRAAYKKLKDKIELGYVARDTVGNALEVAAWVAAQETPVHSLRVVTASYHMPRALWELRRALPGVHLIADPAFPAPFDNAPWWRTEQGRRLTLSEYLKIVFSVIRPLLPLRVGRA